MNAKVWDMIEKAGTERGHLNSKTGLYEYSKPELQRQRWLHRKRIRDLDNIESMASGSGGVHYSANDDILFLVAEVRRLRTPAALAPPADKHENAK